MSSCRGAISLSSSLFRAPEARRASAAGLCHSLFSSRVRAGFKFVTAAGAMRKKKFGMKFLYETGGGRENRSQRPFQKILALTRLLRLSIQSDLCVKELSRATTCSRHMVHVELSLTLPNTTNPVARHNRRPPRGCHDPANFFRWTTQYSCTPRCGLQQKNERSRKKRRRKKWGLTSTYYNCAPCSAAYTRLKAFLTLASAPVIVTVLTGSPSCLSDTLTRLPDCFMIF